MADMYQALLSMLAGATPGASPEAILSQLLNDTDGLDPTTRALLEQSLSGANQDAYREVGADEEDYAEPQRRGNSRLRQRVEALYDELVELRERNDTLARALGACNLCWGDDPGCEVCGGAGNPGSFEPDPTFFQQLVVPALRRLMAEGSHRPTSTPRSNSTHPPRVKRKPSSDDYPAMTSDQPSTKGDLE